MYPDFSQIKSPCYLVDEVALEKNLKCLKYVQEQAHCKIILALKGFAMFSLSSLIRKYLPGVTASSLNEAKLGALEFKGEVHACAPAYRQDEFSELCDLVQHITFNSVSQWQTFQKNLRARPDIQVGLRINPEHSEVKVPLYDPCSKRSRLGIRLADFKNIDLTGVSGLHFHTLCELNSDSLERTLSAVEEKFGSYIKKMKWVNFGGGHHITRSDYDVDNLIHLIRNFKSKYDVEVYLEPGEAIALNTGILFSRVLDIVPGEPATALLDTSAAAHMPDVIEMPYRPEVEGAGQPQQKNHTYQLGGLTCLAGDVIGDYSFDQVLQVGDEIILLDMAHYSMVKNNTFNGVNLPSIGIYNSQTGDIRLVKEFGYQSYRDRLS